jgi:hypothetical protein
MSSSFECSVNESGALASGSVCCRTSKDYGPQSCTKGQEPRTIILAFDVPNVQTHIKVIDDLIERASVNGSYGVLAPDKIIRDGGNKVSVDLSIKIYTI